MIIDCISDLHGHYPKLEGGDLLIVAGDLGCHDVKGSINFGIWIMKQDYKKKIIIAGNHDNWIQSKVMLKDTFPFCDYLCDSGTEFQGHKIWGSPWCKWFPGVNPKCTAFMLKTEEELAQKWALIPRDVGILITHSPPIAVLDRTIHNDHIGSVSLSAETGFFQNLKLHVFGHVHESYGKIDPPAYLPNYFDVSKHYSVNASHVNERYEPVNKPVRVIL